MWTHSLTDSVIIIFLYLKTSREGGGCYDLIPPTIRDKYCCR